MGSEIKFKPATFYLGVVDHLAKVVEGLKPEDVDAERDDHGPKRGHGEILDAASDGVAHGEAKQAPITAEEGITGFPHTEESSDKGKDEDPGPATVSGLSELTVTPEDYDKATDDPLPITAGTATSISSTRKSDSHTSQPQQQSRESGPEDPRPVPTRETLR